LRGAPGFGALGFSAPAWRAVFSGPGRRGGFAYRV